MKGIVLIGTLASTAGAAFPAFATDSATYAYYSDGRLHTVTFANGTVITYTYDAAGNRINVVTTCSASGC